jgi:3-phosphoshikimate 1-carboxyvinyltransferase
MTAGHAVTPVGRPLDAVVTVPGSKSATNRALVAAALACGDSTLDGLLLADDTHAMIDALGRLGVTVTVDESRPRATVRSAGAAPGRSRSTAGSGHGVAVPHCGGYDRPWPYTIDAAPDAVTTDGRPGHGAAGPRATIDRPVALVVAGGAWRAARDAARKVSTLVPREAPGLGQPPGVRWRSVPQLSVRHLHAYVTRLSEAAPSRHLLRVNPLRLRVNGPEPAVIFSRIARHGACDAPGSLEWMALEWSDTIASLLDGCDGRTLDDAVRMLAPDGDGQPFRDALLQLIDAGLIEVAGLPRDPTPDGIRAVADELRANEQSQQADTIRGVAHIRHKETDRIGNLAKELRKLGALVVESPDGLQITPATLDGATIQTYDDHRMAMSFALLGLRVPGIEIVDPDCVAKTFPDYFDVLATLGTPLGPE